MGYGNFRDLSLNKKRYVPYGMEAGDSVGGISLANIIGYWNFETPSGNFESKYFNDPVANIFRLTVSNAPTYQVAGIQDSFGIIPNAAGSSARKSTMPTHAFLGNVDFSLFGWFKLSSKVATQWLLKYGSISVATIQNGFSLRYDQPTDRFIWGVGDEIAPGNMDFISANTFGSPSTGVWYFILVEHQGGVNITISINNGIADFKVPAFRPVAGSGGAFEIGGSFIDALGASNTTIDEVGFFKRLLTSNEKRLLYNNGLGVRL